MYNPEVGMEVSFETGVVLNNAPEILYGVIMSTDQDIHRARQKFCTILSGDRKFFIAQHLLRR